MKTRIASFEVIVKIKQYENEWNVVEQKTGSKGKMLSLFELRQKNAKKVYEIDTATETQSLQYLLLANYVDGSVEVLKTITFNSKKDQQLDFFNSLQEKINSDLVYIEKFHKLFLEKSKNIYGLACEIENNNHIKALILNHKFRIYSWFQEFLTRKDKNVYEKLVWLDNELKVLEKEVIKIAININGVLYQKTNATAMGEIISDCSSCRCFL